MLSGSPGAFDVELDSSAAFPVAFCARHMICNPPAPKAGFKMKFRQKMATSRPHAGRSQVLSLICKAAVQPSCSNRSYLSFSR